MCKLAKCAYDHRVSQDFITGLQLFNLFGMLWLLNFVSAFSQMVLAITFASWYWTLNKKNVPFFTLTKSVYKTIRLIFTGIYTLLIHLLSTCQLKLLSVYAFLFYRYHLGTVAFGSLIISICDFLRAMLEWAQTKLKKYDNSFTRAIFTCMKCFFWLLNKFLCFVNRNAYIMCAMYGNNFCTSARQAFELVVRNIVRVVVVDKVYNNMKRQLSFSNCRHIIL